MTKRIPKHRPGQLLAHGLLSLCLSLGAAMALAQSPGFEAAPQPLVIGDSLLLRSSVLKETRRINVYLPDGYAQASPQAAQRWPVLYMPDGGLAEDFLHIAGLLQVSVANGTMRPFILVGIENTERRRDLTGPSVDPRDLKIAPRVGGSAAFRQFIREELKPAIQARYRTTTESAVIGESLAGLFVVETWVLEPTLFERYIAIDPSLWWNHEGLKTQAAETLKAGKSGMPGQTPPAFLFMAASREPSIQPTVARFAELLRSLPAERTGPWQHLDMPQETHASIYHPAALLALRQMFKPTPP